MMFRPHFWGALTSPFYTGYGSGTEEKSKKEYGRKTGLDHVSSMDCLRGSSFHQIIQIYCLLVRGATISTMTESNL